MKKEIFIANGRKFADFESVEDYCDKEGFRITNTQNINGVHVISITAKEQVKQHYDWDDRTYRY